MKTTPIKKTYCYMKNITVAFEWLILSEVTFNEDGKMMHYNNMEWLPVSEIIEIESKVFDPCILDQLDQLDKIESQKHKESYERIEQELSPIKDRRAALLSLTDQSSNTIEE